MGKTKDLALALGLMAFFMMTLFLVIPQGIYVPGNLRIRVMSPAFFPRVVTIFLIFMSGVLLAQTLIARKKKARGPAVSAEEKASEDLTKRILRIPVAIVLLFFYYAAVTWIGLLFSSMIFLLAFSLLYGERRFRIIVPLAVVLPIALYYFFTRVAHIPLPKGILFD
jgi:putative tricarboxylic transport membrane protein